MQAKLQKSIKHEVAASLNQSGEFGDHASLNLNNHIGLFFPFKAKES